MTSTGKAPPGKGRFTCQTCGQLFSVGAATLRRYPGWTPRFCQPHSPRRRRKARDPGGQPLHDAGPQEGIFTDGSCSPNPGPGGWGVVWVAAGQIVQEARGHEPQTTNNRMELQALIAAYELLPAEAELTVYSDSRLCVRTVNEWARAWQAAGWTRRGGPVKNLDLVRRLYELAQAHPGVRLAWIAAHTGHRWNEHADRLATAWRHPPP